MDHPSLSPLIEKYRGEAGVLDLDRMLHDKDDLQIRTQSVPHNHKKLTKLVLPDGLKFFVKPTSYQGATAEKVVAEIYRKAGIVTPHTTVATLNQDYCTVTNDIFAAENTEAGESFFKKITPGGAQFVLPKMFCQGVPDHRIMSFFDQKTLKQIALHYGLALATKNWDANIGNLGLIFNHKKHDYATGLVALDFEQCFEPEHWNGYANPFDVNRMSALKMMYCFKNYRQSFIDRDAIAQRIRIVARHIDSIVEESQNDGFQPDKRLVEELKFSMNTTANSLQL